MGVTLNMASATNAYVLSDRATWLSFKNKSDLVIVVEGDKRLFNQYGVMLVNPQKHPNVKKELGQQFIDWLVSPEGQKAIADYKINGEQLFYPNANDPSACEQGHIEDINWWWVVHLLPLDDVLNAFASMPFIFSIGGPQATSSRRFS
jgi:ABC-type Fe3+ transport system substrate-binding protein